MNINKITFAVAMALCVGAGSACAETAKPSCGRDRILFFCAHPDDIISSLGTCLLMRDRFELHVCDFTYGERGLGEEGFRDGSTKAKRMKEEEAVCAAIGAQLHWYGAEDGNTWAEEVPCRKFAALLKELKPRAVFGHWPMDVHNDHMMSAAVLQKAVKLAGIACEFYFFEESYDSKGFPDVIYVDITSVAKEKERIIRLYACQNPNDSMCREEMSNSVFRGKRLMIVDPKTGRSGSCGGLYAEAFATYVGRPQGPSVFTEIPRTR